MNKRIIFVPQLPVKLRYSEWWINEFEKEFKKHYDDVIVLGKNILTHLNDKSNDTSLFAPINESIKFEQFQINEFLDLDISPEDTLFLSDISFPGFFTNVLHHKRIKNAYAFCHGTSKNAYDYFQNNRDSKWLIESGHSKIFKKVFVATNYHKEKLRWKNIKVVGVPEPPFEKFNEVKENNIISVNRNNIQKRNKGLEKCVEQQFGKIIRQKFDTWKEYYQFISKSKILLITTKEETFGYSALESIKNNCIPLAPNKFSYPELIPKRFLYNSKQELIEKIEYYLNEKNWYVPKLINQELIDNFYGNVIREVY